jgi:hypothetical protein
MPLEIQIWHRLIKTSDVPEKGIEKAVVSVLFDLFSFIPGGDPFLNRLGIGTRELRINGTKWDVVN